MHTLRTQVNSLVMRQGLVRCHLRRASGSSSFPELAFPEDQEEIEPEDDENAMEQHLPILRSRHTDLFYMPNCVGPAYQGLISSAEQPYATAYYPEEKHIENSLGVGGILPPTDMWVVACPKLLAAYMRRLFQHPYARFCSAMNFSMIGLRFHGMDTESALRSFVLLASYNAREIMYNGYWADFINPLTGRAHFRASNSNRKKNCPEAEILRKGMVLSNANGCTVIEEAKDDQFTGCIFTDTPLKVLESWCV